MKKYSGFTLVELMVVLAIIAIVMAFGMPSFNEFVKNDRLSTQINLLVGHLAYARSEAVLRAQQVGLCASSNSTSCTGSWSDGWLVYVDANGNSGYDADADTILRVHQGLPTGMSLNSTTIGSNFLYDRRGYAATGGGNASLCDDRGAAYAKMIFISNTGRVRQKTGAETPSC
jgi:type IV fimbrial biogenesis protein FimT